MSERAHEHARDDRDNVREALKKIETELDAVAAQVWGISDAELADIQFSLADLR